MEGERRWVARQGTVRMATQRCYAMGLAPPGAAVRFSNPRLPRLLTGAAVGVQDDWHVGVARLERLGDALGVRQGELRKLQAQQAR